MIPRVALGVAGLAALALPLPGAQPLGVGLTLLGVLALARSLRQPGSTGPAAVIAAAALSWLSSPGGQMHDVRLVALALALAVVHSSAALAAVVPPRSRVPGPLLARWAGWTVAATAAGVAAVEVPSLLHRTPGPVPITVAVLLAVGGCLALGARAGVRRG